LITSVKIRKYNISLARTFAVMLTDPENYEEWEYSVWAVDESEAWKKCQLMVDGAALTDVINVTSKSAWRDWQRGR